MEAFIMYVFRSVIWLTGFALVYYLFLRNERFFELNRCFLVSGIVASLLLPFITISYKVLIPVSGNEVSDTALPVAVQNLSVNRGHIDYKLVLIIIYATGLAFVAFMIFRQGRSLMRAIRNTGSIPAGPVKLIRSDGYDSPFSFFSWVFVNPSVPDIEMREIMNHEMVHIRQKHWLDLMLAELLRLLQWFNPMIWIYIRFIRQNHEYIADRVSLQRTSDPAVYRAALLNQIAGSQVISLTQYFSYSLSKKRFTMMEKILNSPYRKLKLLLILPVFAIVFYAFAKPDYQYAPQNAGSPVQNPVQQVNNKKVTGNIIQPDGKPLQGAHIIVVGTTMGTISDEKGSFSLINIPADAALAISYVGFKSKVIKSEIADKMPLKMERDTISLDFSPADIPLPPPPPPPSTGMDKNKEGSPQPPANLNIRNTNGEPPSLIVLDGEITDKDVKSINPATVESITVLKDEQATGKYGDKGKNGVIEIKTKKTPEPGEMFVAVEELPEFPGGSAAMQFWIQSNLKRPADPVYSKMTGKVYVNFIVTSKGKISTPMINKSVHPLLDLEAVRLVTSMPDWKPGKQGGKAVDVQMILPVEFK